jgi:hypothetical protein
MSTFCRNLPYGPRSSPAVGLPHSKSIDRPAMKPLPPTRYQYAAHRQAPDAAVRSETNPDNVGWTFEMYSGREHAVNSDSFSRQPGGDRGTVRLLCSTRLYAGAESACFRSRKMAQQSCEEKPARLMSFFTIG